MLQQPILRHLIYRKRLWQRTQWKKEFTEWEKLESERLQAGAPARALSTHEKGSTLDSARGLPGIGTDLQQPIELHGFPTHSPNAKEPQTKDGKPYEPSACDGIPPSRSGETYLIQLLGSYEIARAIALECHYSDMKSLMLVSQGLKNAVLGSLNAQMMVQLTCTNLKRNSHMDAEEVQEGAARTVGKCWNCKGKICQVSSYFPAICGC
ncbi:hypothetical protein BDZ91DRAFT_182769 [Kalaharituber pfeilii]|nr:hypothetical protein BDZ91DRAFT_182769 [Kalaharituber pfeilii]